MGPEQLVRLFWRIGVAGCLAALLSACGSKSTAPSTGSPSTPSATVTAVTISGPLPEIGATTQLTATAALSDGSKQDVTAQASWQTSNAGVITVSDRGVARGVGAGEADVSASYSGSTGSQHVRLAFRTFTLAGTISEVTTGRPIGRSQVEILDGKNAGKRSAESDDNGRYSLQGLLADTFKFRARANGYDFADRIITIVDADVRADMALRPSTGPGCVFSVTPATLSFSKTGGSDAGGSSASISIGTTAGCAWSATADASWIFVSNGGPYTQSVSGSGTASITAAVNPNTGVFRRTSVKIRWATGGTDVPVTQNGSITCVSSIAPDHQDFGAGGGSGTIAVTAPTDCSWAANAFGAFIAITGGAGGTGNGTVSYTVAPNSSTVGRSGEIGIAEPGSTTRKSFTVTQTGTP